MQQLFERLQPIPAGKITDGEEIISLLADCWDQLQGSNENGMQSDKLLGRAEDLFWEPPFLCFTIERHGGTVLGSTRAELQQWRVNVENRSASCSTGGWRQLKPVQPKLNVKPIAEEIVSLILNRKEDSRLKWNKNGSVRIAIGNIIPASSAVAQTLAGRRKRFRGEVDRLLTDHGWEPKSNYLYTPPQEIPTSTS